MVTYCLVSTCLVMKDQLYAVYLFFYGHYNLILDIWPPIRFLEEISWNKGIIFLSNQDVQEVLHLLIFIIQDLCSDVSFSFIKEFVQIWYFSVMEQRRYVDGLNNFFIRRAFLCNNYSVLCSAVLDVPAKQYRFAWTIILLKACCLSS